MKTIDRNFLKDNIDILADIAIGPLDRFPERVIQFGEGNFLRAFVDWQFNEMLKSGLFNGSIVVVQPIENGMVNELNEQDGIYTLLRRGIQGGMQTERMDIISCISRGINPYSDWQAYLDLSSDPNLRFVVSNTTEVGIAYTQLPKTFYQCPKSFPALVTILLFERFKKFNGDPQKGFIFLVCELIERNGDKLKSCILNHAIDWSLGPEFIQWIEESNYFCNTLVDRIVPGFPKDEIETITEKLGYVDKLLVTSELFHRWVIQGNEMVEKELPFTKAGLNVIWADDITPYSTLKVRILNGMHTMFTIPSFLCGQNTVCGSMEDTIINKFINKGLLSEILPTLDFPEKDKQQFAHAVLERFQNPFIKHYLLSMTLHSISKFNLRVLPSIVKYYELKNQLPEILTFSLASLIYFYKGEFDSHNNYVGNRFKEKYQIRDDQYVIQFIAETYSSFKDDPARICSNIISNQKFWDADLTLISGFTERVIYYFKNIQEKGMRSALYQIVN